MGNRQTPTGRTWPRVIWPYFMSFPMSDGALCPGILGLTNDDAVDVARQPLVSCRFR